MASVRYKIQIGATYRHYKGKNYRVRAIVKHSETCEDLVLYEALYANELGSLWVRPIEMFLEDVVVGDQTVARFSLIGDGTKDSTSGD